MDIVTRPEDATLEDYEQVKSRAYSSGSNYADDDDDNDDDFGSDGGDCDDHGDNCGIYYVHIGNQISIESFGRGLLRGMGWKPGEALGKTFKGEIRTCKTHPETKATENQCDCQNKLSARHFTHAHS